MTKTTPDNVLEISPRKGLRIQQADLSEFAPYGESFYGYQKNTFEPIKGAPSNEGTGGHIYFQNNIEKNDFEGFLRMMNVRVTNKDFAAFIQESSNPMKDKYLTQMRIVPKFALRWALNTINDEEYNSFKDQDLNIGEALWEFMNVEKERYGTNFWDSPKLAGIMGGDGHFGREELSFGFMVENGYYNISRIWSRAWIVTK